MATRRMKDGRPATDERIAALAAEAEAGYAPEQIHPPRTGRPPLGEGNSRVVQFRLDAATFEALVARARAEHRSVSEIARAALESYLQAGAGALAR